MSDRKTWKKRIFLKREFRFFGRKNFPDEKRFEMEILLILKKSINIKGNYQISIGHDN